MRTLVRVVAAVVIVAVIGFVLARLTRGTDGGSGGSPPALSSQAATSSFQVRYPATWHRLSAPPAGLLPSLSGPLALAPAGSGEELVIGTVSAGGAPAGQLPNSVRTAVSTAHKQMVSLGGRRFYRYLLTHLLTPKGQGITESIYVLDTTNGTVMAVCAAQKPSDSFTATCERMLASLKLTSGSVVAPPVQAGYALGLNAAVAKLNAARRALGPALSTGSLAARAQAARRLGAAHSRAATSTARLSPDGAGLTAANQALVSALGRTGTAYEALGRAINDRRQTAYRSAEDQIQASSRALGLAYARLHALGYRIA